MSALAACTELTKRYGDRTVVDGVSFEIASGETYGLLGPNGAGKTTTINMLTGVLAADGGRVTVDGTEIRAGRPEGKSAIGVVPQELALYPDLSARENLAFFGRLQGLSGRSLRARMDEVLEIVGLTERARERVDTFSGGMKRRVNIAVGLLHQPRLLVLDEPTVGVDPQSRDAILANVEQLGGSGLSVLYTTHYMEEAERLCDRVGIIDQGHLVAEGTQRELVAQIGATDRIRFDTTSPPEGQLSAELSAAGALEITQVGSSVTVTVTDARSSLAELVAAFQRTGAHIDGLELVVPDLEEVFLHLTGRALRD